MQEQNDDFLCSSLEFLFSDAYSVRHAEYTVMPAEQPYSNHLLKSFGLSQAWLGKIEVVIKLQHWER